MGQTIDHFMWGYQIHFRATMTESARRIFSTLDKRFKPEIFLVGILVDNQRNDRYPACVEPENDFWAISAHFDRILSDAAILLKECLESKVIHSHPTAQKNHDERLIKQVVKDSIQKQIDENSSKPDGMSYFVSVPTALEGYFVSVAIGLQSDVLSSYQCLKKIHIDSSSNYARWNLSTSFIGSVIETFLTKVAEKLRLPELCINWLDTEEILLNAAKSFMSQLAFRTDPTCYGAWNELFRNCNDIASSFYEKSVGIGTILLARNNHPGISLEVSFLKPVNISNTKGARKLLQLASADLALHCDGQEIYGLVRIKNYEQRDEDIFKVKFIGHHHWEISHSDQTLMRVKYGRPYLPKAKFDETKLREDLPRIFKKIKPKHIGRIVNLVHTAATEQHGTMLLITNKAKQEAQRLQTQSILILPRVLTEDILRNLTPIDGAVILNPAGSCYAIGAILDGIATDKGNPARGARYNSAIRYVESSSYPSIAIIISEDGDVDFVPELKPALNRAEIDEAINKLQAVDKTEKINREFYCRTRNWLDAHRFYLRQNDCDTINDLIKKIDDKLKDQEPASIFIVMDHFTPNLELDEELYYQGNF